MVDAVCKEFQHQRYHFWIDNHNIVKDLPYPKHSIVIGGHIPDIFGVDTLNRVFAVEAKGDKDIEKAIGQALVYKKGVSLSFVAASKEAVDKYHDIISNVGLGIITVENVGEAEFKIDIKEPNYSFYPVYYDDVKNEIDILLLEKNPDIRLTSLGKTQVLNYLGPMYYCKREPTHRDQIGRLFTTEWGVKIEDENNIMSGCEYLGLISQTDQNYEITNLGLSTIKVLRKLGFTKEALISLKTIGLHRKKVYTIEPELAYIIRTLYEKKPEYQHFLQILYSFPSDEISFKQIIEKVIEDYPTMFLQVFCKSNSNIDEIRELFYANDLVKMKSKQFLEDKLNKNVYFAFKIQLLHLGILKNKRFEDDRSSGGHYKSYDQYDFEKDIWVINPELRHKPKTVGF